MAATYSALAQGVTWPASAAAKNMLYFLNGHASLITRIYRVKIRNLKDAAITGAMSVFELNLASGTPTGGTNITSVRHDTNSTDPPTTLTMQHGVTSGTTLSTLLRSVTMTSEEPLGKVNPPTLELSMIQTMPCFTTIDFGYGFSTCQPITLRQNEGFAVTIPAGRSGGPNTGVTDIKIEFTHT